MTEDTKLKLPETPKNPEKAEKAETYTYVGAGTDIPDVIKFMGLQEFVRGEETAVTNPRVLEKIKDHPCFVKGAADRKAMHEALQEAREKASAALKRDKEANDIANKRNAKFKA